MISCAATSRTSSAPTTSLEGSRPSEALTPYEAIRRAWSQIAAWSGLFFGRKALGPSALTAGAMIAVASLYAAVAARTDKIAAATAAPLIGWLGFATLLAAEVWRRNDEE